MGVTYLCGDVLDMLATLPDASVQCVVTSPPYYGLRDYGVTGQIGLEPTPEAYVAKLVDVFRGVRRVLRDDGVLWLNLEDSYAGSGQGWSHSEKQGSNTGAIQYGPDTVYQRPPGYISSRQDSGLKPKDLIGIPWRVAFALQADGWWLRSDCIWHKPNPMPESVTDRPTKAHEYVFLLSKSARYYYDAEAVKEPCKSSSLIRLGQDVENQAGSDRANGGAKSNGPMKAVCFGGNKAPGYGTRIASGNEWRPKTAGVNSRLYQDRDPQHPPERKHDGQDTGGNGHGLQGHSGNTLADGTVLLTANARTVWTIATSPYKGAHFATFPEKLALRCILAGSKDGDTVLDPFGGSGTVGKVAVEHGRDAVLIDLNPRYIEMAKERIAQAKLRLPI